MMENAYGIGVKNRYDIFLNEEEDPLEILKQQEEKKEKKKTDKVGKEPKVKSGKQNVVPPPPKKGGKEDVNNVKTQELPQKRSERPPPRIAGERSRFATQDDHKENEERKNKRNREAPFPQADGKDRGDVEFGMRRGRGGGRGRGRGGRGRGAGMDGRGKREFDRQSGSDKSGVKPVDKKEGGGAHNWGTMKDELDSMQFNTSKDEVPEMDRSAEEIAPETTEPKEGEGEAAGDEGKISADDEPKEMTLDEWKQQQEEMRSVPKFNLRKPGEGESQTQAGKKLYILKKKEGGEDEVEDEEESEDEDELSRRGRQKHVVDIEINFSDSRRGRGRGRGGMRGSGIRGGRGAGGIGSGRGLPKATKSSRPAAPKVDDLEDFPSLATA